MSDERKENNLGYSNENQGNDQLPAEFRQEFGKVLREVSFGRTDGTIQVFTLNEQGLGQFATVASAGQADEYAYLAPRGSMVPIEFFRRYIQDRTKLSIKDGVVQNEFVASQSFLDSMRASIDTAKGEEITAQATELYGYADLYHVKLFRNWGNKEQPVILQFLVPKE